VRSFPECLYRSANLWPPIYFYLQYTHRRIDRRIVCDIIALSQSLPSSTPWSPTVSRPRTLPRVAEGARSEYITYTPRPSCRWTGWRLVVGGMGDGGAWYRYTRAGHSFNSEKYVHFVMSLMSLTRYVAYYQHVLVTICIVPTTSTRTGVIISARRKRRASGYNTARTSGRVAGGYNIVHELL